MKISRLPLRSLAALLPPLWAALVVACSAELADDASTDSYEPDGNGAPSGSGGANATGGAAPASGGTTDPGSGGTAGPSYEGVALSIERSCATQSCHGAEEEPHIANDGTLPAFLLGTLVEECAGLPLVTPGQPESSALLKLVNRDCGELFMPENCTRDPCLPDDTIATWTEWILAGAPMQ
ncbi:MAG TPA: hypothetical protein VLC09_20885 [Polyangiaceae bacterium]|nr:hypothetical protein [Polyangiaceae bacterium]